MDAREIFELNIPPGKLAITWFNSYSGVVVKTPEATLIFDPVKASLGDYVQADAIVITHEHLDHFDPVLAMELHRKTKAPILTTPFVARSLPGGNVKALKVGDCFAVKDVKLHALRCDHPANEPLSFAISTRTGITVYHPGDSDPFPEMAEIVSEYRPAIVLYVGTSLGNAARIARLVKPRTIVSYYTDAESQRRLNELIQKEAPGTKARTIKRFEIYQYPNSIC